MRILLLAVFGLSLGFSAKAGELKVFELFTDHGILQQNTEAPIWGTADPGTKVTVQFRGETAAAAADAAGQWMARLKTPKAEPGQKGTELTIAASGTSMVLHDVVVGEVWLGSGQSNIDTSMKDAGYRQVAEPEMPKADYPMIRLYSGGGIRHKGDFTGYHWAPCTPETVKAASATGYFFSRDLHKALGVPVGFINLAVAASPMSPFLDPGWLAADPRTAVSCATGKDVGAHYKTHIAPVMPFAFAGILWDQGESGTGFGMEVPYAVVYEIMLKHWREGFGRDLPVIFCGRKGGSWGPLARVVEKGNVMGEPLVRLCVIRIADVRREPLDRLLLEPEYSIQECHLEGFPGWDGMDFVGMFIKANNCLVDELITRIAFEYVN